LDAVGREVFGWAQLDEPNGIFYSSLKNKNTSMEISKGPPPLETSMVKKQFGQFYTSNYQYILQDMTIPSNVSRIVEPFVGTGELLQFIEADRAQTIVLETYDIEPKCEGAVIRDTLYNPPCYDNAFVLTNPPFFARNKNANKGLYEKYMCNDLYKCFLKTLMDSECIGGIIILPLNFLCSIRTADVALRRHFLEKFDIDVLNIFEERVFDDTRYAVCSIQFSPSTTTEKPIRATVYPSNIHVDLEMTAATNYTIGGELYALPMAPHIKVERATWRTNMDIMHVTNILLKCIDDSPRRLLGFSVANNEDLVIDTTEALTTRSYATMVFNRPLTQGEQETLVARANTIIQEHRDRTNSLCLSQYRENTSIARKRISFDLAFRLCNHLLSNMEG
jgi:hypothetical protein